MSYNSLVQFIYHLCSLLIQTSNFFSTLIITLYSPTVPSQSDYKNSHIAFGVLCVYMCETDYHFELRVDLVYTQLRTRSDDNFELTTQFNILPSCLSTAPPLLHVSCVSSRYCIGSAQPGFASACCVASDSTRCALIPVMR